MYWIQHATMLVVPYYLLRLGGVYTLEDVTDIYWPMMSYGILLLYHFTVLQAVGMASLLNLFFQKKQTKIVDGVLFIISAASAFQWFWEIARK